MMATTLNPDQARSDSLWSALDAVTIASVSLSYLFAIIFRPSLTLGSFAVITTFQVIWFLLYRHLVNCLDRYQPWTMLGMAAAAVAVAWTINLGIGLDWLLLIITCGIFASLQPLHRIWPIILATFAGTFIVLIWPISATIWEINFWQGFFSISVGFIFSVAFSAMMRQHDLARQQMAHLVEQLEESRDALQEAHTQLRTYSDQVEELAVVRERNRMAREIHDTLGHYLTILALKLETATKMEELGDERLRTELVEARRVASECLGEVRHSVAALRPADLTIGTLDTALGRLVDEFAAAAPTVEVTTDLEGDLGSLVLENRLTLYRVAQEALTNIRKHAQASKVLLRLRVNPDIAELTVLDNGIGGQQVEAAAPGFGLLGMRERLALLNGLANAGPIPGRGWRVEVTLPLRAAVAEKRLVAVAP